MKTAIAIFVKTPGLSSLKTRLAAGIGTEKALDFYNLSIRAVEKNIKSVDADGVWAVTEEDALDHSLWEGLQTMHSSNGDLGDRQHHVYDTLLQQYDGVFLIGSDSPQMSPDILNAAITALESHDFVIGPARDGGYYLFGGKVQFAKDIWKSVPWGVDITRQRLEDALPSKAYHLPMLSDVDTQDDLSETLKEMPEIKTVEQEALIEWINNLG